jgi:hypothetical protein
MPSVLELEAVDNLPTPLVTKNPVAILPIGDVRRFLLACLPRELGHDEPVTTVYM